MQGILTSKKEVAENAFELTFSLPKKIVFDPGQYVTIKIPSVKNDPRGNGRIFSLVNPPKENKIIKILLRSGLSPYKNMLLSLPPGSKVNISDPIGEFSPKSGNLVFLAAGVGIAPFMSMQGVKATWFYTNKTKLRAPYLDKIPKNSHLIFTNTHPRLTLNQITSTLPSWPNCIYYIAGIPEFVEDLEKQLIDAKIPPKNIFRESFE